VKVFLDTDIGDDIDDALALIMLLKMNRCDLVGISTVYANTNLRARLVKKILQLMGKEIPVYAGRRKPWKSEVDVNRSFVQYTTELDEKKYLPLNDSSIDEGEMAIDALIEAGKKYKEDLTILAIGPYTNVASAVKKDKSAFEKTKIVLMGGCFYEQFVEYNVFCDPEAADYLYRSGLNLRLIGGDVTWQVQLNDEQTKFVLNHHDDSIDGYACDLIRMWKKNCWFNPVLHDPLACFYAIDPTICTMEDVWVEVELTGSVTRGFTANRDHFFKYLEHPLAMPRLSCAKTVDVSRFIATFLQVMFQYVEKKN
jgi:purine nucleosidase